MGDLFAAGIAVLALFFLRLILHELSMIGNLVYKVLVLVQGFERRKVRAEERLKAIEEAQIEALLKEDE